MNDKPVGDVATIAIAVLRTDWEQTDSGRRDADTHRHAV